MYICVYVCVLCICVYVFIFMCARTRSSPPPYPHTHILCKHKKKRQDPSALRPPAPLAPGAVGGAVTQAVRALVEALKATQVHEGMEIYMYM